MHIGVDLYLHILKVYPLHISMCLLTVHTTDGSHWWQLLSLLSVMISDAPNPETIKINTFQPTTPHRIEYTVTILIDKNLLLELYQGAFK